MVKSESVIQAEIVGVLRQLGFFVYVTSNNRQRGSNTSATKGIPDLLIANPDYEFNLIGLEVKKPKGEIKPEQKKALEARHYAKATSVEDAMYRVIDALKPGSAWAMKCFAYLEAYSG